MMDDMHRILLVAEKRRMPLTMRRLPAFVPAMGDVA